jgi:hypothetical protein
MQWKNNWQRRVTSQSKATHWNFTDCVLAAPDGISQHCYYFVMLLGSKFFHFGKPGWNLKLRNQHFCFPLAEK